jgi:capsular exopolysaccharide synthesis family protein
MSIVERSLQKHAARTRVVDATASADNPSGAGPASRPERATAAIPARQYRAAQLNSATLEANRIIANISDPAAMAAYKMLRTRILQRTAGNASRSFGVTGTVAGEGKSLTAINLALALARDVNTHVFLVDMDLQRPSVATQLGLTFDKGLSDYLVGQASLDEVIYSPGIDRFAVIPGINRGNHSSELLASPRMDELMDNLAAESPARIIIYDLPPLLVSDDVLTIAPRIDGLLLVVSQGMTERKVLESAREMLSEMNLIGVVLNRSTEHEQRNYDYYQS